MQQRADTTPTQPPPPQVVGYVLVVPCSALLALALATLFFPLRKAYDDIAETERSFALWRGGPLRRVAAAMLLADGEVAPLFTHTTSGYAGRKQLPAPLAAVQPQPQQQPQAQPQQQQRAGGTGGAPGGASDDYPHALQLPPLGVAAAPAGGGWAGALPSGSPLPAFEQQLRALLGADAAEMRLFDPLPGENFAGESVMRGLPKHLLLSSLGPSAAASPSSAVASAGASVPPPSSGAPSGPPAAVRSSLDLIDSMPSSPTVSNRTGMEGATKVYKSQLFEDTSAFPQQRPPPQPATLPQQQQGWPPQPSAGGGASSGGAPPAPPPLPPKPPSLAAAGASAAAATATAAAPASLLVSRAPRMAAPSKLSGGPTQTGRLPQGPLQMPWVLAAAGKPVLQPGEIPPIMPPRSSRPADSATAGGAAAGPIPPPRHSLEAVTSVRTRRRRSMGEGPLRQTFGEALLQAALQQRVWFDGRPGHRLRRLSWRHIKDVWVAGVLIGTFLVWMPIAMNVLELFSCALVDTNEALRPLPSPHAGYWLVQDVTQRCYAGRHLVYVSSLGAVGVLCYCVAVPVATFAITARLSAQQLHDRNVITRFGFLFFGYRKPFAWWESVVMLRKILVVVASVFAGSGTEAWTSPKLALAIVMGVILASMLAQVTLRPHAADALNRLEFLSLLCTLLTCLFGLFFSDSGRASPLPLRIPPRASAPSRPAGTSSCCMDGEMGQAAPYL